MIRLEPKDSIPAQYRQGDILLIKVEKALGKKQELPKDRLVLAYGEVTGHAHAINDPEGVDLYIDGVKRYLELCFLKPFTHEEHGRIDLPISIYEIRQAHNWSVLTQLARQVAD